MYYILYLSAAIELPGEPELIDILSVSRRNNSRIGVTGVLLYGDGQFIQLLEGDKADVQATFEKISNDNRHKGITMVTSGNTEKRSFPEWSMGFKSLNTELLSEFEGYLSPGDKIFPGNEDQLKIKLLKSFIRTSRLEA